MRSPTVPQPLWVAFQPMDVVAAAQVPVECVRGFGGWAQWMGPGRGAPLCMTSKLGMTSTSPSWDPNLGGPQPAPRPKKQNKQLGSGLVSWMYICSFVRGVRVSHWSVFGMEKRAQGRLVCMLSLLSICSAASRTRRSGAICMYTWGLVASIFLSSYECRCMFCSVGVLTCYSITRWAGRRRASSTRPGTASVASAGRWCVWRATPPTSPPLAPPPWTPAAARRSPSPWRPPPQ